MTSQSMDFRRIAGEAAVDFVRDGMILGIGSGSTAGFFIDALGDLFRRGVFHDIRTIPTSLASEDRLARYGIPIVSLADFPILDLAVDGADEVDPDLNLIKGLGRALMREKVVEIHARRLLIVVDENKIVSKLGNKCPLPVEILSFEAMSHIRWLNSLGCRAELWNEPDGTPAVTENGNYLARMWFENGISDPHELACQLNNRPGILEHGLFLDMASDVLVAGENGIRQMRRDGNG